MLFLPCHVDVPMARWPITNFLLIGGTFILFAAIGAEFVPPQTIEPFILKMGDSNGIYGHMFIHLGYLHIFGNMVFL